MISLNQKKDHITYKKFDCKINNYLSDLDLIHKYLFQAKKEITDFKKISLELPIQSSVSSVTTIDTKSIQFNNDLQIRYTFFLYLLKLQFPFILTSIWKNLKTKQSSQTLKITLIGRTSINQFLIDIFLEKEILVLFNIQSSFLNKRTENFTKKMSSLIIQTYLDYSISNSKILGLVNHTNKITLKVKIFFSFNKKNRLYYLKNPNFFKSYLFYNVLSN